MSTLDPFAGAGAEAVAVGTGRLTLDVIVRAEGGQPRSQAGGTCGNVLANLAYLGWSAYPLTDLGDDDPGARFCRDLTRWGVRLDLIRTFADQETPVIIHHIRQTDAGPVHSFSSRCPFCARKLRYYEPVPEAGVRERLSAVPPAAVCFFDRDSEGAFALTRHCAERGALVVFEPNYAGRETMFGAALPLVHVLKVSGEKLAGLVDRLPHQPPLVIETNGAQGLRYLDSRRGPGTWRTLSAFPVPVVRDAGGSGDWCTAGLLHLLGRGGLAGFQRASDVAVTAALRFGMALAAWNCAFEGARGGVYMVERERMQRDVRAILAGASFDPLPALHPSTLDDAGRFCPGCGGHEKSS